MVEGIRVLLKVLRQVEVREPPAQQWLDLGGLVDMPDALLHIRIFGRSKMALDKSLVSRHVFAALKVKQVECRGRLVISQEELESFRKD